MGQFYYLEPGDAWSVFPCTYRNIQAAEVVIWAYDLDRVIGAWC